MLHMHKRTEKNPFGAGAPATVWPKGMGGRGKVQTLHVPTIIKQSIQEIAQIYAHAVAGNITPDEAIKRIRDLIPNKE